MYNIFNLICFQQAARQLVTIVYKCNYYVTRYYLQFFFSLKTIGNSQKNLGIKTEID